MAIDPQNIPDQSLRIALRETANRIVGEFCNRRRRKFLSMRLKGQFRWPSEFTQLTLFGRDWLLWPNTEWDRPGIIIHCQSDDGEEEARLAMRFLSALAWLQQSKIEDEGFWVVGTNANPCFRDEPEVNRYSKFDRFRIDEYDYLPFPVEEKAQIALALYREALVIDEEAYKFLSFYKVINVRIESGSKQIDWINQNVDKLKDHSSVERIQKLRVQNSDIGNYLYVSGRCAVAHAWGDPIVNPDNPNDKRRLSSDLPIIKALAEFVIENEFGIKSRSTIYREHLYELEGFKKLFGSELVQLMVDGYDMNADWEPINELVMSQLTLLSVRLRGEPERPYEDLTPELIHYEKGRVLFHCVSSGGLTSVNIGLNFIDERLDLFEYEGFNTYDDNSPKAAHLASIHKLFLKKLFANGVLEVWSGNKLLGRKDAFLPTNIDMNSTSRNFQNAARRYQLLSVKRALGSSRNFDSGKFRNGLMQSGYFCNLR